MNKLRPYLHWVALITTFVLVEFIISRATYWFWFGLAMLGIQILLAAIEFKDYHLSGFYRSLVIVAVTGISALFFIDLPLWQHAFALIIALVVLMHFLAMQRIISGHHNLHKNWIALPLSNIFFAVAAVTGASIFLKATIIVSISFLAIAVLVYPICFNVLKKTHTRQHLPIPGLNIKHLSVNLWFFSANQGRGVLKKIITLTPLPWWPNLKINVGYSKLVAMYVILQTYLAGLTLPTNILVNTSLVVIIAYTVFNLISFSRLGILSRLTVYKYVGLSSLFILVIFSTAQWT